jgi:co-chaperonin GroES (HSP10)
MILNYKAGEDLKQGNIIALGPDGKFYKTTKPFGKVMRVDLKAGEKIQVNVGK